MTKQPSNMTVLTAYPREALAAGLQTWTNSSAINNNTQSPPSHHPLSLCQLQIVTAKPPDIFLSFINGLLPHKHLDSKPMPNAVVSEVWLMELLGGSAEQLSHCRDAATQLPDNEPQPTPKPKPIRDPRGYRYRVNMGSHTIIFLPAFHPDNEPSPPPQPTRDPQGYGTGKAFTLDC